MFDPFAQWAIFAVTIIIGLRLGLPEKRWNDGLATGVRHDRKLHVRFAGLFDVNALRQTILKSHRCLFSASGPCRQCDYLRRGATDIGCARQIAWRFNSYVDDHPWSSSPDHPP